jgi:hypothetical protein
MNPGDIFPYLTGAGGALFLLIFGMVLIIQGKLLTEGSHNQIVAGKDAMIADKDKQITNLTSALEMERRNSDVSVAAAQSQISLLRALREEVGRD